MYLALSATPHCIFIFQESSDQMIIVWNTVNDTKESIVMYGPGGKLDQTASGSRTKFVDGGKEKRVQFVHKVVLKGLSPETEYCKCITF